MSSQMLSRLVPAAKFVFASIRTSGVQGILLGGAAQAMLGGSRNTKDLDINVSEFPKFNHEHLYKRAPNENGIMHVTYMDPEGKNSISCDVVAKSASMIALFLKHSCYDWENGIWYANHALLLADKIHTFVVRREHNDYKRSGDLQDIRFCIDHLASAGITMPDDLKTLYSADDWAKVKKGLVIETPDGQDIVYFAEEAILV